jgi:hypothetical protein
MAPSAVSFHRTPEMPKNYRRPDSDQDGSLLVKYSLQRDTDGKIQALFVDVFNECEYVGSYVSRDLSISETGEVSGVLTDEQGAEGLHFSLPLDSPLFRAPTSRIERSFDEDSGSVRELAFAAERALSSRDVLGHLQVLVCRVDTRWRPEQITAEVEFKKHLSWDFGAMRSLRNLVNSAFSIGIPAIDFLAQKSVGAVHKLILNHLENR